MASVLSIFGIAEAPLPRLVAAQQRKHALCVVKFKKFTSVFATETVQLLKAILNSLFCRDQSLAELYRLNFQESGLVCFFPCFWFFRLCTLHDVHLHELL